MIPKPKRDHATGWLVPVGAVLVLVMLWVLWAFVGVQWVHKALTQAPAAVASAPPASAASVPEFGQVGDLFGGVNALFAALACAGVFWAGYIQRRTLIETREGLQEERARLDRQQFESTFFQLVGLFRDLLRDFALTRSRASPLAGRDSLTLEGAIESIVGDDRVTYGFYGPDPTTEQAPARYIQEYRRGILNENRPQLDTLFRTLAELLCHVEALRLSDPDACTRYGRIARALLPAPLVALFTFHARGHVGLNYTPLIERFELLDLVESDTYLLWALRGAMTTTPSPVSMTKGGEEPK